MRLAILLAVPHLPSCYIFLLWSYNSSPIPSLLLFLQFTSCLFTLILSPFPLPSHSSSPHIHLTLHHSLNLTRPTFPVTLLPLLLNLSSSTFSFPHLLPATYLPSRLNLLPPVRTSCHLPLSSIPPSFSPLSRLHSFPPSSSYRSYFVHSTSLPLPLSYPTPSYSLSPPFTTFPFFPFPSPSFRPNSTLARST